jgi:hypothetical protein
MTGPDLAVWTTIVLAWNGLAALAGVEREARCAGGRARAEIDGYRERRGCWPRGEVGLNLMANEGAHT